MLWDKLRVIIAKQVDKVPDIQMSEKKICKILTL